jgi:hypothetical protein
MWVPLTDSVKSAFGLGTVCLETLQNCSTNDCELEEETVTETEKRTWIKEGTLFLINKIENALYGQK